MQSEVNEFMDYVKRELSRGIHPAILSEGGDLEEPAEFAQLIAELMVKAAPVA